MMNINTVIKHLTYFTTGLPHRGSTTEFEKQASEYSFQELSSNGYSPIKQSFRSAVSAYYPALVFGLGMVGSILYFVSFPSNQSVAISIIIIGFFLINILLDSAFKTNIFSLLLPKRNSQNIIARLPSVRIKKRTLILIAHLDSHRTPLLFSSPFWVRILKLLIPISIVCSLLVCFLILLYLIDHIVFTYLLLSLSMVFLILIALMGQADLTPYTTGANDNASGAATVLALAQYFKMHPLHDTELYFVLSGCEEVGSYGARAFAETYKRIIPGAYWFTIDGVSASDSAPALLSAEIFLLSIKSDQKLIAIARKTILDNPHNDAFILPEYRGAYTDSSPGGMEEFKVISLVDLKKNGALPSWHTLSDNFQNIDKKTLQKCVNFSLDFISNIDKSAL